MRTSSSSQSTGGTLDPEHRRDVEVDLGPVGRATRARRLPRASTSAGSTACACSSLVRTFVAVLVGADRERGAVRLGGLVEEERPGVGGRVGDRRLDDACAELLEALDVRLAATVLRPARGRPPTAAASSSPTVSPASRGAGSGAAASTDHIARHLRDGGRHRADGVEAAGRADTRRRSARAPSSA